MLLRCFFYINTELLSTPQALRFSHRDKREARVTGDETQGTRVNAKAPACPRFLLPAFGARKFSSIEDIGGSASDSQSGGSGFESSSRNLLDLFSVVPS